MQISAYFQKAMLWLLSSSRFGKEELHFPSLSLIHEIVYRVFSFITAIALVPTLVFSWRMHEPVVLAAQGVIGAIQLLHLVLLMSKNYRLLPPLLMFSVSILLWLLGIMQGEHALMYWATAFPPAFYLLVESRSARIITAFWVVFNIGLAFLILRSEQLAQFIASLITTSLFVEALFTILNRHEKHLEILATKDPLTGAYNRRRMIEDLDQAIALCNRHDTSTSVIVIDVDKFKPINDRHGHQEGDAVLKNLAQIISDRLRCTDRFYRYGGEEFVALLSETCLCKAGHVASALCDLVRNSRVSTKQPVTISCGVAQARQGDSVNEWISRADQALYRAKMNGRNRCETERGESPIDELSGQAL